MGPMPQHVFQPCCVPDSYVLMKADCKGVYSGLAVSLTRLFPNTSLPGVMWPFCVPDPDYSTEGRPVPEDWITLTTCRRFHRMWYGRSVSLTHILLLKVGPHRVTTDLCDLHYTYHLWCSTWNLGSMRLLELFTFYLNFNYSLHI